MALTKEITINKIESVGPQRTIQIQYKTSVKEDGKEISFAYTRRAFDCGRIDGSDNWIDTDSTKCMVCIYVILRNCDSSYIVNIKS